MISNDRHIVVACLMGLPGSGKSSFCSHLIKNAKDLNAMVWHLPFDAFEVSMSLHKIPKSLPSLSAMRDVQISSSSSSSLFEFDVDAWHESRKTSMDHLERVLNWLCFQDNDKSRVSAKENSTDVEYLFGKWIHLSIVVNYMMKNHRVDIRKHYTRHIVLVDDNMYYNSMRRRIRIMSLRKDAHFFMIWMNTSLDVVIKRNEEHVRPWYEVVPLDIIKRMDQKLEVPDKSSSVSNVEEEHISKMSKVYDNDVIVELNEKITMVESVSIVKEHIISQFSKRCDVKRHMKQKQKQNGQTNKSDESAVHRLDIQIRSILSTILSSMSKSSVDDKKKQASVLQKLKQDCLNEFRKDTYQNVDVIIEKYFGDHMKQINLRNISE